MTRILIVLQVMLCFLFLLGSPPELLVIVTGDYFISESESCSYGPTLGRSDVWGSFIWWPADYNGFNGGFEPLD